MFTMEGLARWAEKALAAGAKYWYGTCWYLATEDLMQRKKKQYPSHYTDDRLATYRVHIAAGKMVCDCVGLIKGYFWTANGTTGNKYATNNCPDRSANGMFSLCEETGKIGTIPEERGLVVWRSGHIGVYVGGGYAIEARGFKYGVVKTRIKDRDWTNWGRLPAAMLCGDAPAAPVKLALGDRLPLNKGMEGDDVAELQMYLKTLGYDLGTYGAKQDGVDGEYGAKTRDAVIGVQKKAGLKQTGEVDQPTLNALLAALDPEPAPEEDAPSHVLIIEGSEEELRKVQAEHGGMLAAVDSVTVS